MKTKKSASKNRRLQINWHFIIFSHSDTAGPAIAIGIVHYCTTASTFNPGAVGTSEGFERWCFHHFVIFFHFHEKANLAGSI